MMQKYSRSKLAEYIRTVLDSKTSIDKVVPAIAAYLMEHGRTHELDSLMRDVAELRAQKSGIVEARVASALPLDKATRRLFEEVAIAQYQGAKRALLYEVRDESLIGGASLSLANASLDLTVRTKLNHLREAAKAVS